MNSVMESLYFGVLAVVVPQMIEQRVTTQPCTELGLGIALDSRDLTAEKLLGSWRMTTGFGLQQDGTSATNQPLALAHVFRYTSSSNGELHKQLHQRSN